MSRCFPFPPPGYARHSDALIDSIKIQSVSKKAKKDRKKKDKESKEKRREKKDKKKDKKGKEVVPSNHDAIVGKELKLIEQQTTVYCVQQKKGAYHENEQLLERSDITEEHDQPVACCSDSIQSSSKRKRSTSPSPSTTTHNHGTVKRIRFSLRKPTEPEQSKSEDQLVLASESVGSADSSSQVSFKGNHLLLPCDTNAERDQFIHREELQFPGANGAASNIHRKDGAALNNNLIKDEGIQLPGANGAAASICQKDGAASTTNLIEDEGMRMASVYDSLFQNWVPPSLSACDAFDLDNDWLFRSEPREERPISKTATHATSLRCSGTSMWPRAQYLPEVETYALPYVVPF